VHPAGTSADDAAPRPGRDPDAAVRWCGDEATIRVTDDMLDSGVADLRWLIHAALVDGARRLVVDLDAVERLSSSAVASLLSAHRACRARGGRVVLHGAGRRTRDLLVRTGLRHVLGDDEDAST
jgi:anti-anti-sigma factor